MRDLQVLEAIYRKLELHLYDGMLKLINECVSGNSIVSAIGESLRSCILTHLVNLLPVWLQYAIFEEIDTQDYDRARDVYKAAIKLVPHKQFTFAKVGVACRLYEGMRH